MKIFRNVFLICLTIQFDQIRVLNAQCICIDKNTGSGLGAGVCCSLGSLTCNAKIRSKAACVKDGQKCPRPLRPSAVGHFIAGSISWKALGGNSVEFEIVSTWRYSFNWPYRAPVSTYTGPCGYPGVGDMVPLVGLATSIVGNSSYTASVSSPLQTMFGKAFLQLESGEDGNGYEVFMHVVSLSVEEDWITGIARIPVRYSKPFAKSVPYFPADAVSYVASTVSAARLQPYQTVPWVAQFVGCCRAFQTLESDGSGAWDFNLTALVDLSDALASPRVVSLPVHWIPAPSTENDTAEVEVCAMVGVAGMRRATSGTLNYAKDDDAPVQLSWQVLGPAADRATFAPPRPAAAPNCRTLLVRSAIGLFRAHAGDSAALTNAVTVAASLADCPWGGAPGACVAAAAELALFRVPEAAAAPRWSSAAPPFACAQAEGHLLVAQGFALPRAVNYRAGCLDTAFDTAAGDLSLELRYVAATPSAQTGWMAVAPGQVAYTPASGSGGQAAEDSAGLPSGAVLASHYGVLDIQVAFSSGGAGAVPLGSDRFDYAPTVGEPDRQGAALLAAGYQPIPATDFNAAVGGGGASVTLYAYIAVGDAPEAAGGPAAMAAITGLRLLGSADVVVGADGRPRSPAAQADGYTLVERNLLEGSGLGAIYLAVRRGSGPPLAAVTGDPAQIAAAGGAAAGWQRVYAESWVDGVMAASAAVYFLPSSDRKLSRRLQWTPCSSEPSQMVLCAAAAPAVNRSVAALAALAKGGGYFGSPGRCVLVEVAPAAAPAFSRCDTYGASARAACDGAATAPAAAGGCGGCGVAGLEGSTQDREGVYQARMGEEVRIPLALMREGNLKWAVERVGFSPDSDVQASPPPGQALTAGPPGARGGGRILSLGGGVEGRLDPPLGGDGGDGSLVGGVVSWWPSPLDGFWSGQVCVDACLAGGECGARASVCSKYCVKVRVEGCGWRVRPGDSLTTIAARFRSNWIQMWLLNPKILHPDEGLLAEGHDLVAVGRLYHPLPSDTIARVGAAYGLSAGRVLELNAHLAGLPPDDPIPAQVICVMADSCLASRAVAL